MTHPDLRWGGRPARAGRPPLVWALSALLGSLVLSGCIGGAEPLPSVRPGVALSPDAERLADWSDELDDAENDAEREAVMERALRGAGVAPLADRRVPGGVGRFRLGASLAGWIPGRRPVHRDSLVVVVAPRDGQADLALVEAARLLSARGAYTQTPERSVLVVLGDDAAPATRLWDRSLVVATLGAGPGPDSLAGVRVERVPLGEPVALASTLYGRLAQLSTPRDSEYTPAPSVAR